MNVVNVKSSHRIRSRGVKSVKRQAGISLYTMLAAIVVLGILSAILVTSFSGNNSKAQMAYSMLVSVGQAEQRFNLDTGCYTTELKGLIDKTTADSNNSCSVPIDNQWGGPYLKNEPVNASGNIMVQKLGPNVVMKIKSISPGSDNVPASAQSAWGLQLTNLQTPIAKKAEQDCGGTGNNTACTVTTASGTSTLTYVFVINQS